MTQGKKGNVTVLAEMIGGVIAPVSLQLTAKGQDLADQLNSTVTCILLGDNIEEAIAQLIAVGADKVLFCDDSSLRNYQQEIFLEMIVAQINKKNPEIFLIGSTTMGRELAPLIAARLQTGITAHCVDLKINQENILDQIVPAYGGMITIQCPEKKPQMATVANGVFPDPKFDYHRNGIKEQIGLPAKIHNRIEVLDIVAEHSKRVALKNADLIIAGGSGAGDLQGWGEIAELADLLNAGLGATRPAVDEGWVEIETMIGQSGKMVSPTFYIGIGISGDLQHMVGVKNAKVMVAVNKAPNAPIFAQVNYGIVADCRKFVPILIEKISEKREEEN